MLLKRLLKPAMATPLRIGRHAAFLRTEQPFVIFLIGHKYPSFLAGIRSIAKMQIQWNPLAMMEDEALSDPNSGLLHVERREVHMTRNLQATTACQTPRETTRRASSAPL